MSAVGRASAPCWWRTLAGWRTLGNLSRVLVEEALSPSRCAACDERLARRAAFCPPCAGTVDRIVRSKEPWAFGTYGGALTTSLRKLKYEGRSDLAAPLGDLACSALPLLDPDVVVVPVPLHPARLVARGYNQSALLASRIAAKRELACWPSALSRLRDTPQQARLSRGERHANVESAFRACGDRLRNREVLLVDDVTTTGATLDACRAALLDGGATRVTAIVVAWVDPRSDDADREPGQQEHPGEAHGLSVSIGSGYDPATVSPRRASLETSKRVLDPREW